MNPRRELAKAYAELAAGDELPLNEQFRLIDKALFWSTLPDDTEAKPKTSTPAAKF